MPYAVAHDVLAVRLPSRARVREDIAVFEVAETRDLAALEASASRWGDLLAETPGANFFQTLDWLRCYLEHADRPQELRVLLVREGETLVGIVPLVVRLDPTPLGTLRTLTYPLDDWGTFYGPIGPDRRAILRAALSYLQRAPRDWDVLDLRWIDHEVHDAGATAEILRSLGYEPHERRLSDVAVADLPGDWKTYLASRKRKFRENLRRAERKAAAAGKVGYIHFRPAAGETDPRWDLYDICESLAARSWQGSVARGTTLSHASVQPFLRAMHKDAVFAGGVDIHILTFDEQPVAFLYNYCYRGHVYGLRSGYDPDHCKFEVARLLMARSIETCISLGDRTFDLGPDQIDYKRHWATRVVGSYAFCHYPRTAVKSQALAWRRRVKHWLGTGASHAAPKGRLAAAKE